MSGYTPSGAEYDSYTTTSIDAKAFYFIEFDLQSATTLTKEVTYQLSNNGSFYANDEIVDVYDQSGRLFSDTLVDEAGNNWFYGYTTFYGRTHDGSFNGSFSNTEEIVHGRNGINYISDSDAAGDAGSTEQVNASNGSIISIGAGWSDGTVEGGGYAGQGLPDGSQYDLMPPDDGNANPNVKTTSAGQTMDLPGISHNEFMADFTAPSRITPVTPTTNSSGLSPAITTSHFSQLLSPGVNMYSQQSNSPTDRHSVTGHAIGHSISIHNLIMPS